jgi:hypothetical protein
MSSNPWATDASSADFSQQLQGLGQSLRQKEERKKQEAASAALGDYLSAGQDQPDSGAPPADGGTLMQPQPAYGEGKGMFKARQELHPDALHPDNLTLEDVMDPMHTQQERMALDEIGITPDKHDEVSDFGDKFKNAPDAELGGLIKDRVASIVDRGGDASHTASLMGMDPDTARAHVDAVRTLAKRDAIRRIAMNDPQMAYKIMSDEQASRRADIAEKKQEAIMQHFMSKDAQGQQRADAGDWSKPALQQAGDGSGKLVMLSQNLRTGETRETPVDAKFQPRAAGGGAGTGDPNAPLSANEEKIAQQIYNHQLSPLTMSGRSPRNMAIMARVSDIGKETGKGDYNSQDYYAQKVLQTKMVSGDMGKATRSLNVAQTHLDALDKAAEDLSSSDVKAFNRGANLLSKEFGGTKIASFQVAKNIVADEVIKSIVGGQNSDADRQHMQQLFDEANSPEQLKSAIAEARTLIGGQLKGMRTQFTASGKSDADFDKFLDPQNRSSSSGDVTNKTSSGHTWKIVK